MFPVRFARTLCFLKFPPHRSTGNLNFETEKCFAANCEQEYCFVQWKRIESIQFSAVFVWGGRVWPECLISLLQHEKLGLAPVEGIRCVVQTVWKNLAIFVLDKIHVHAKNHYKGFHDFNGWENELIYVNRFHVEYLEEFQTANER